MFCVVSSQSSSVQMALASAAVHSASVIIPAPNVLLLQQPKAGRKQGGHSRGWRNQKEKKWRREKKACARGSP